jgi:hypothetical protein
MPIPAYDDWMKITALGVLKPRSSALKEIDSAIKEYWKQTAPASRRKGMSGIRLALENWIREKGPNWRNSERNKAPHRIVSELYRTVTERPAFTPDELAAFRWQDDQRRLRLGQIFAGKEIVWRAFNNTKDTQAALAAARLAAKGGIPKTHQSDVEAIKKFKDEQNALIQDRKDYGKGPGNAMRQIFNKGAEQGLGIGGLVQKGIGQNGREHNFGVSGTRETSVAFQQLVRNLFGGKVSLPNINTHLLKTLGTDVGGLSDTVMPIVSNITSGVKLVVAWGTVALSKYREYETGKLGCVISRGGDMEAAFKALQVLLDRKVTSDTIQASIQTADFATRTAMSFVDFGAVSGAAVGVVSSLSKLVHKLYLMGREYSETHDARILLSSPANLDDTLFEVYPLLGCYMLLCSDLSELLAMSRAESIQGGVPFGADGWMDDVEYLKKHHVDPVLTRATEFVHASLFKMPNMPLHALYQPGGLDKLQQKISKGMLAANVGQIGQRAISAFA